MHQYNQLIHDVLLIKFYMIAVKGGSVYNGASPLGCSAWLDQITT